MTLGIVGDIDPVKTFDMVQAYFGSIPRQPDPFSPRTVEPEQQGERRIVVEYEAEPRVIMAWHVMAGLDADFPAFLVMDDILTGGRSSRFTKEVVEKKKIAASVSGYTGIPGERFPGLYMVEAVPLSPHTTAEVEEAVYAEIERLKREPVTEAELAASKTRYRKNFADGLVDNLGLAQILAYNDATLGDWREGFRRADLVAKVTAADVQRVAATYLKASNRTVGTLVKPQAEAAFVDPAAREKALALVTQAVDAMGGSKALAGLRNVRTESAVKIHTPGGAIEGSSRELLTADGKMRNEISIMGQNQIQVFDGQSGWMGSPAGTQDAPPEMLGEMRSSMTRSLFLLTFDPSTMGGSVRLLDGGELGGQATEALQVDMTDVKSFVIHLDPATQLPLGMSFDSTHPLTGQPGKAEMIFTGYAPVSGIQFPAKSELKIGGQTVIEETVTQRSVNTSMTVDEFRKPS
jgi:hypothetical protein